MNFLEFAVPFLPPSVNHYKQPRRGGGWYRGSEAMNFVDAVCIFSRKVAVVGPAYEIDLTFCLPPEKQKRGLRAGDLDNFLKVALDALVRAGVIIDDGCVLDLHIHKRFVASDREAATVYQIRGKAGKEENGKENSTGSGAGSTEENGTHDRVPSRGVHQHGTC